METNNYYEILGVNRDASEIDIKIAYKQLAKKYHPDLNKEPDAKNKFIQIHEAYNKLLNPEVEPSLMYSIFNMLGIELWDSLIKKEDFDIPPIDYVRLEEVRKEMGEIFIIMDKEFEKLGITYGRKDLLKMREYYRTTKIGQRWSKLSNEDYKLRKEGTKEYNWAKNKIKLLNKIYFNFKRELYYKEISRDHLNRVLKHLIKVSNKEELIRMPEKFINPINKEDDWYEHRRIDNINKICYNLMNQFHPKFLNKMSMRVQIFINYKMKDLILKLEKELEN